MAGFQFLTGAFSAPFNFDAVDWVDPPGASGEASRLNTHPGRALKRLRAFVGQRHVMQYALDTELVPSDAVVSANKIEGPAELAYLFLSPGKITFQAAHAGHYVIAVNLNDATSGAFICAELVPIDFEVLGS